MSGKLGRRSASSTRAGSAHPARSAFGALPARLKRRIAAQDGESGFTLMETIVSITILGILMTASTAFFISANRSTSDLRRKQAATELAVDALEQANAVNNALNAGQLIAGRDQTSEHTQWQSAFAPASAANPWSAAGAWLANTNEVWDAAAAPGSGATCVTSNAGGGSAPLCISTAPTSSVVDGITYQVNTYIGKCYKAVTTADNSCGTGPTTGIPFYRVVAAVSWQGSSCPLGGCIYLAADLKNATGADPLFNVNQVAAPTPPPIINNPGPQSGTIGTSVYLPLAGSGGSGTYTWKPATGTTLPGTVVIDTNSGLMTGTLPATTGSYTVSVTMTDSANTATTTSFTWTVNPAPTITAPTATQLSATVGKPYSWTLAGARGTTPYTWTVSGALPAGLTLANGVISGTPTTAGSSPVTVTLTDKSNYAPAPTANVTITVNPAPTLTPPGAQISVVNRPISPVSVAEAGGSAPLSWSISGVPGLSISSSGVISGSATAIGAQTATVTVTDAYGASNSTSFSWTVTAPLVATNPGSLISWPTDQVVYNLQATGGTGPYTWTATGLPTGLTVNASTGTISGTPALSAAGSTPTTGTGYPITVTATDYLGATSSASFTWTIKLRSGVIKNGLGNYCVNDANSTTPPSATSITSYACATTASQSWTIQTDKTIKVSLTGGSFCLSANGSGVGATVALATCNAALPAQQWTPTVNGSVLNLVNQGQCLALSGTPASANGPLTMQTCTDATDPQRSWTLPS